MFAEDLDQFFDTRDFAVPAVVKRPDGTTVRTANVILGTPKEDRQLLGEGRVTAGAPRASGTTAHLGDVQRGWALTVGSTVYEVTAPPEDDGSGVSTVKLRKR